MIGAQRAGGRWVDPWNLLLAALTLAVFAYGAAEVPNFLSAFNLSQLAAGMAE
jgi:rhamnose transport system permease protein